MKFKHTHTHTLENKGWWWCACLAIHSHFPPLSPRAFYFIKMAEIHLNSTFYLFLATLTSSSTMFTVSPIFTVISAYFRVGIFCYLLDVCVKQIFYNLINCNALTKVEFFKYKWCFGIPCHSLLYKWKFLVLNSGRNVQTILKMPCIETICQILLFCKVNTCAFRISCWT